MDEFHEIKQRLDKYGDRLSGHDTMIAILTKDVEELEAQGIRVCKIMTETREEVMTTVNTRFDTQDNLLQQLLADKHRKEGEEAANKKNQQDADAKTAFRFKLIDSIPNIFMIAAVLAGIWAISQPFIPHK
jgi:hypothetical protein